HLYAVHILTVTLEICTRSLHAALPISSARQGWTTAEPAAERGKRLRLRLADAGKEAPQAWPAVLARLVPPPCRHRPAGAGAASRARPPVRPWSTPAAPMRSEERRVGNACRSRV